MLRGRSPLIGKPRSLVPFHSASSFDVRLINPITGDIWVRRRIADYILPPKKAYISYTSRYQWEPYKLPVEYIHYSTTT